MKFKLLSVFVLFVLTSCATPRISPVFEGPAPLAALLEENPWAMVIGADVPLVALYADGQLIFSDKSVTNDLPFRAVRLPKDELDKLMELIGPTKSFLDLHPYFDLGGAFDLPTVKLFLSDGKQQKMVSIYGSHIDNQRLIISSNDTKIVPPKEFVRVQTVLSGLSYPEASIWIPEYFEIIIWPYEYAPNQRPWPESFPDLKDKLTLQRKRDGYSLFIKGTRKDELANFFSKSQEKEAIVIDGKKWAMSVRPVFPSEPVWRAAEKKNADVVPKNNGL